MMIKKSLKIENNFYNNKIQFKKKKKLKFQNKKTIEENKKNKKIIFKCLNMNKILMKKLIKLKYYKKNFKIVQNTYI